MNHADGWIVGYNRTEDTVGKIFDWYKYEKTGRNGITTTLENIVAYVAGEAALPYSGVTHYDFRYPNATNMMLIVEWSQDAWGSFDVKLPGSYAYYERSWSLMDSVLNLDGIRISDGNQKLMHGTLTATQLLPDEYHTVQVGEWRSNYGGLALIYRRP